MAHAESPTHNAFRQPDLNGQPLHVHIGMSSGSSSSSPTALTDSEDEQHRLDRLLLLCSGSVLERGERRAHLDDLVGLLAQSQRLDTLLASIQHIAGDVQRVALDAAGQPRWRAVAAAHVSSSSSSLGRSNALAVALVALIVRCSSGVVSNRTTSTSRTCASALRALAALFLDPTPLAAKQPVIGQSEVQTLVPALLACMSWGLTPRGKGRAATSSQPRRDTLGSAFAFARSDGATASVPDGRRQLVAPPRTLPQQTFAAPVASHNTLRKQTSSSSIGSVTSSIAWDNASVVSASETDVEPNDEEERRKIAAVHRSVRQRSIACLDALNSNAAKSLLLHWPAVLCDDGGPGRACLLDVIANDAALSNRISACRVVESLMASGTTHGFFAGAEERSRLSAFTSLSGRIAATVVQTRAGLLLVLEQQQQQQQQQQTALLDAVLRCTISLVHATGSVKLRQSHSDALRPVALKHCASTDASVAARAYGLLTALIAGEKGATSSLHRETILPALQDPTTPASVRAGAWNALTAMTKREVGDVSAEIAREDLVPEKDDFVRQAVADFVLATLKRDAGEADARALVPLLCTDALPSIRATAGDCLAACAAEDEALVDLTRDPDSTVRASAARAIGVAVQRCQRALHVSALRAALLDSSPLVRQRASWAWGNVCEADASAGAYLADCLAMRGDDERICIHAVRGVGALLAACQRGDGDDDDLVFDALRWLCTLLRTSKDPKMRWNTCASLGRILASKRARGVLLLDEQKELGITMLLADIVVQDKTFKTRLAACNALQSVFAVPDIILSKRVDDALRTSTATAVQQIEQQIAAASFNEAQMHAVPLRRALHTLSDAIEGTRIAPS